MYHTCFTIYIQSCGSRAQGDGRNFACDYPYERKHQPQRRKPRRKSGQDERRACKRGSTVTTSAKISKAVGTAISYWNGFLAENGLGVTVFSSMLAKISIREGLLVRAGDDSWCIPIEIRMFRSRGRLPPAAENFLQSVAAV